MPPRFTHYNSAVSTFLAHCVGIPVAMAHAMPLPDLARMHLLCLRTADADKLREVASELLDLVTVAHKADAMGHAHAASVSHFVFHYMLGAFNITHATNAQRHVYLVNGDAEFNFLCDAIAYRVRDI